jgi:hypothetical protein
MIKGFFLFFLLLFSCFSSKAQTEDFDLEIAPDSIVNLPDTLLISKQDTLIVSNDVPPQKTPDTTTISRKTSPVIKTEKVPNPHHATLWALIPGGGQIYNWNHGDKWWLAGLKLTAVYGGFGALTYFIIQNNNDFRDFRDAYKWVSTYNSETGKGESGKPNKYTDGSYTANQLKSYMDYYQTNREWCYFFTGLLYGLQIVEATVTAHLLTFDVSDNLSLSVKPLLLPEPSSTLKINSYLGLSLRYSVKYK